MGPLLYLDTARLGQTLPAARDAQIDFVRLTSEEPSSLYFEAFLKHGFQAWPDYYQRRFPGLSTWTGVAGLKQSLKQLAGAPHDSEVLLASRSLALVQMAASQMFQACRNVMCTDLSWSTYQDAIDHQATITGNQTTTVPLRNFIFHHGWTADDVVNYLSDAYEHHHCDGLFLPAVDHLGIRVPVKHIVDRIRQQNSIRYTFIDAAQAFCHVPIEEDLQVADFLVTGCHKWMRAGQPMGVGFCRRNLHEQKFRDRLKCSLVPIFSQDSLLQFTNQLDCNCLAGLGETVNLSPLLSCCAVTTRRQSFRPVRSSEYNLVCDDARFFPLELSDSWYPVRPHQTLKTQITLFDRYAKANFSDLAEHSRREWLTQGAVVTAYTNGWVRSSPSRILHFARILRPQTTVAVSETLDQ